MSQPSYDDQNPFAKILRGDIKVSKVYEDDVVVAFHDLHPQAKTHVLVIPKGAYRNFSDLMTLGSEAEQQGYWKGIYKVVHQLGLHDKGYSLSMNKDQSLKQTYGVVGPQTVFHLHTHIVSDDGA